MCFIPGQLRTCLTVLLLVLLVASLHEADIKAANLPPGFTETRIAQISSPIAMEFSPDGRIFVTEQSGSVRIIKNGVLLPTPFATISVLFGWSGLLGITLHPDFPDVPYVYIYYTSTGSPAYNRVSRLTANGDVVVPDSERILIQYENTGTDSNHDGGALHFGPDGKLYISTGDNHFSGNGQSLETIKGKILRLNDDGSLPEDNPFYFASTNPATRAIWCYGLRNPFTFAFQPGTGRMFINDVGENLWEEINEGTAGGNYGWSFREGPTNDPRFISPLLAYPHSGEFSGRAIIGGDFYNPERPVFPRKYWNNYFFMDYTNGWISAMDLTHNNLVALFATGISGPSELRIGPDGNLYYLRRGAPGSALMRVTYAAQVSGTLTLQDCVNSVQPIQFEFRPLDETPPFTRTATLDSSGNFTLGNIPVGVYHVAIKGEKWLQRTITVDTSDGFVSGFNASLLSGDANNDNSVDVFDLDALIQAFDSDVNASHWNENADFNCDGSVDVLDLDLLIRNFDKAGDA